MGIRLRYSHKRVIQQSRIGDLYREVSTISLCLFFLILLFLFYIAYSNVFLRCNCKAMA